VSEPVAYEPWDVWFRAEIERRGLTQERAARELDVTLATVSRWRRGHTSPSYPLLWRVYDAWGTLPAWMLTPKEAP
jgi:transcriptional regulator with XRE-family HTH domain